MKIQWTVIQCRRQTETIINQGSVSGFGLHHTYHLPAEWFDGFHQSHIKNLLENNQANRMALCPGCAGQKILNNFLFHCNNPARGSFPGHNSTLSFNRCASINFPADLKYSTCDCISSCISYMTCCIISFGAKYKLAGKMAAFSITPIRLPVTTSILSISSISSPKKLIR